MKKKSILLILLSSFLHFNGFAQDQFSKNLENYVKEIFILIKNNNTEEIERFLYRPTDTLLIIDPQFKAKVKFISMEPGKFEAIEELKELIAITRTTGEKIGVKWGDAQFVGHHYERIDSDPAEPHIKRISFSQVHFISNGVEYRFILKNLYQIGENWREIIPFETVDYQKDLELKRNKPFSPYNFEMSLDPMYLPGNPKTISNAYLKINNKTPHYFNYIKFNVHLVYHSTNGVVIIINRTFESKQNFYSGDVFQFEIPELRGYFTGVDLSQTEIEQHVFLVDAKPNPEFLVK
jgi:hypothetical protein